MWLPGGACVVAGGCMVAGSVCGCRGVCVVAGGCMVCGGGGGMRRARRDTVNGRAVRILLECILVLNYSVPHYPKS